MAGLFLYEEPRIKRILSPHLTHFEWDTEFRPGPWDLVVRWGNVSGTDAGQWVLNPKDQMINALSRSEAAACLALNRIPCLGMYRAVGIKGRYRVFMFDHTTMAIARFDGRRFRRFAGWSGRRLLSIRYLARRALYVLGLHFGMVDIGLTVEDKFTVVNVTPIPIPDRYVARRFAHKLQTHLEWAAERRDYPSHTQVPEVVLGADPEFMLRRRRTGRMVSASRYFTRYGTVGLDRLCFRRDGVRHYPLAELRPAPSASPHELVDNLKNALTRAARAVRGRGIRFEAGSLPVRGCPLGGHIHFSNLRPTFDLLWALDNYLAVPLLLLENPRTARMRRPRYGFLGDWRLQRHGGFEYRTLGSWLLAPEFALAVLSLAKVIAHDYPYLRRRVLGSAAAQEDFYRARKDRFRAVFPDLWSDLMAAPSFGHYADELSVIEEMVLGQRRWNERVDIKRHWQVN